jgi:hypothetical protein
MSTSSHLSMTHYTDRWCHLSMKHCNTHSKFLRNMPAIEISTSHRLSMTQYAGCLFDKEYTDKSSHVQKGIHPIWPTLCVALIICAFSFPPPHPPESWQIMSSWWCYPVSRLTRSFATNGLRLPCIPISLLGWNYPSRKLGTQMCTSPGRKM